jgi:plasmid stabilization system protein ParE
VVEVLEALTAFVVVVIGLVAGAAAVTSYSLRYSLRRANRLVPGRATPTAPLSWLWSPSPAAALHRRLRSACKLASSVPGAWRPRQLSTHQSRRAQSRRALRASRRHPAPARDGIAELAREVLEGSLQLDGQIVSASWLARGVPRARALAQLEYEVASMEDAARRVHQLAERRARLSQSTESSLSLQERIAAMEAAISELTVPKQ